VVVGWTDPDGSRRRLGALLLAYYDTDGRLIYAGRVGTGIKQSELERLSRTLQQLATSKMPLDVPPPRSARFGSPLVLSRVHWVRPELVAEVKFLAWTDDNPLRQVVYEGLVAVDRAGANCLIHRGGLIIAFPAAASELAGLLASRGTHVILCVGNDAAACMTMKLSAELTKPSARTVGPRSTNLCPAAAPSAMQYWRGLVTSSSG
jgi:hypothetical protein